MISMNRHCALMLFAVVSLASCSSSPITDDRLISIFLRNRSVFESIAQRALAERPYCHNPPDAAFCDPKGSVELVSELRKDSGLPISEMYINRKIGASLWIPVQTYGPLSISSSTRGYVYSGATLLPIVKDTLDDEIRGYSYRPIGFGWMIYLSN